MLTILAATSNKHKIQEFRWAFRPFEDKLTLITPSDLPSFVMPEENGSTFEENALIKAVELSRISNGLAFADDSGLEVTCLDNAPGIYSARYAGENASDAERIAKLLDEMAKTRSEDRSGRFVCAMALACKGRAIRVFRGEVPGSIALSPMGEHGFGYDPVFVPDGFDVSFGLLPADVKDSISHRARALEQLSAFLREELENPDGPLFQ